MKKIILVSSLIVFLLACMNSTTETTIAQNGSGMVVTYVDMSKLIELSRQMGKDPAQEKDGDKVMDSIIYFKDKIKDIEKDKGAPLTADEKEVYENSRMQVKMNVKENILSITVTSKFSKLSQVPITTEVTKKAFKNSPMGKKEEGDDPKQDEMMDKAMDKPVEAMSFNIRDGLIENVYDSTKRSVPTEEDEKMMQSFEMIKGMVGDMPVKIIYNLPRPSKSVTGKAKTEVSADKKKVTISYDFMDVFKDPSVQSYKIEY